MCCLYFRFLFFAILLLNWACTQEKKSDIAKGFELQSSEATGINFSNDLDYDEHLNAYTYRNFYNGAGVALGDINNDGLIDIYIAGNRVPNKLYLNKGNFQFEDITESAGVGCAESWSTGVSMADINGDGLLDIFVCVAGPEGLNQKNKLFINNGDSTFTESAEAWGVADTGLSTHAVFFDYDQDGDLDFYLLNNSTRSVGFYDLRVGQREERDPFGGNKLYRNDGGLFTDVSEEAGIFGSAIGYGLGVTVADINKDGWMDIYVSNDFFEKDYLYINNGDGTFTEALEMMINEISLGSMGADIADITNDGYPEIYVSEMLPEPWPRVKKATIFEDWDKYQANMASGYYHQFTRNTLQLNQGPVPGNPRLVHFSEIGRLTNTHATDWSWGALIFDYNNDGLKDIFVANGIPKDLTDQDYINYSANQPGLIARLKRDSLLLTGLLDRAPSVPVPNYLFENQGALNFTNKANDLGLDFLGFSNGAAYADLNNDGFLDLVVNNINAPLSIYKNLGKQNGNNHYIQLDLKGGAGNTFSIGSQVTAYCGPNTFYVEQAPVKGYLSSIDHRLHLGLGKYSTIDSLKIKWPDGRISMLYEVPSNQILKVDYNKTEKTISSIVNDSEITYPLTRIPNPFPGYRHVENQFSDFDRDRLLFEMLSNAGPAAAVGDVNGDGLDDIFLGGAKDQPGALYIQNINGTFTRTGAGLFEKDQRSEDVVAVFFDADGDGYLDLFVGSGGSEFGYNDFAYRDRLYLNDGKGNFTKKEGWLAKTDIRVPAAFIIPHDFDNDGFTDLILGTRHLPFFYGKPASVFFLKNDGKGNFEDVSGSVAPQLQDAGLFTDGALIDIENDGSPELLIAGEWMGLRAFRFGSGGLTEITDALGLSGFTGLWESISIGDFDGDGFTDFIVGNHGLNSRYRASPENPMRMYVHDFDQNGSLEQIICYVDNGKAYPMVLLHELAKQIPSIKKKFPNYESYTNADMEAIFGREVLDQALVLEARHLDTKIFYNKGGKKFVEGALPTEAQLTKVFSSFVHDSNEDGNMDIILGGNQTRIKPQMGGMNASFGVYLKGLENRKFEVEKAAQTGLFVRGEVRDIVKMGIGQDTYIIFVMNNEEVQAFKINQGL